MSDEQKDKLIVTWIESLAQYQGMYCRLLRALNEADEDAREEFFARFRGCRTQLDFVLAYEC